jgi:hypothetical protein
LPHWWYPTYTSGKGKVVTINQVSSAECPVSLSNVESTQLLSDWSESQRMEGCYMFGPDLSQWPVDIFDAFVIFATEEKSVEFAKYEADK